MTFVAMLDGFALHRIARPRPPKEDAEALFDAMRSVFIAYSLPTRERERWNERFRKTLAASDLDG